MQFKHFLSTKGSPGQFDCASCRGKDRKCLLYQKEIEIKQIDYDASGSRLWHIGDIADIERYWDALDAMRNSGAIVGDEFYSLYLVQGSQVCPIPIISNLSIELFQMHKACGENRWPYAGGYFDQLAIYLQAAAVINSEESRLMREYQAELDRNRQRG